MMLVRSSLRSSVDAGASCVPDHKKQEFLCVWIPGDGSWQEPRECDQHLQQGHLTAVPVTDHKTKDDYLCSRNFLSSSQLSTEVSMSESSTPNFVYKRRTIQKNVVTAVEQLSQSSMPTYVYKRRKVQTVLPAQVSTNTRESGNCLSTNNSEAISVAGKEHMVSLVDVKNGMLIPPDRLPVESNRLDLASKSGSVDGASVGEGPIIEEPKSKMQKCLDLRAVNDSCSSSKSNVDLGSASLKQMDDVGECSSSGALIMEGLGKDVSETNSCISFLRHHGVLEGLLSTKTSRSKKLTCVKQNTCCLRSCKVCGRSAKTLKMLICDLCEESFHMSCCTPPIKKVPVGAWFCHSCLRKKLKKMKETEPSKSPKDYSGPIASMIRVTDPYTSNVRIGKDFQVEVPDWSGPLTDELDDNGEPMEMTPVECASYQDWDSSKLSRLGSIGNWLQCREVVDGVNGTICGKWRRAPLFEVQTDDWECFGAVLWDPSHADCAVPQELDTDKVLKHLKYIEMLRPRLSANRWKLGVNRGVD